ncbi:unnamed protein product (macronuclear) [Paramecium tetraurelia]|uniref:Rab-GAP TBC domain-containing protein n=1 Tax=Paramecium tetraurelia TaxID=5888 RepID=A0DUY9_PARTE|nr:uncharacterized protein GSPATT00020518001 [Paramecium tetraurelia]CAK86856.1 unnamed protein product [Paramecium tetraurelia]|eukprot:XP_001454253.1 hypothetical protein (macronuclear) [Paramecium tetraurelia strain d4-2]
MQNQQFCEGRKIDLGWLTDAKNDYHTLLTKSFRQQFKEEQQNIANKELITDEMIMSLCLSVDQKKEELVMQKKSSVTGGYLDRQVRFEKHILQQLKDHKPVKSFPLYQRVYVETKAADQKTWYNKNGDMARLLLDFEKGHSGVYIYRKDKNQAIKWQRYLIIEKLLQVKPKLVARCFEYCYQEYEEKFTFTWALQFAQLLGTYTTQMNQLKKQKAKLDENFLISLDRQVMNYHIKKWQAKSEKQYKDEQDYQEKMKQLSLKEQEQLKATENQRELERQSKEKRRLELLEQMVTYLRPKNQEIKRFYKYWQDRAIHIHHNKPKEFSIKFLSMYMQSNTQLIRPQLEVRFVSERTENTKDIENTKQLDGLQYHIDQNPYYTTRLLTQMSQQRRRDFTSWVFKDGLLGVCGNKTITIENLGYRDFLDLQVIDTIKTNTSSKVLRIQLQDLVQYLYEGRSFWVQLEFGASKIFVEMDILERSNIDPIFLDRLKFIQLNGILRKIALKIIEQRTPVPISEAVRYDLEIDKYGEEIQSLYQGFYIENICLQPPCIPTAWFSSLDGMDKVVKPIIDILKRNFQDFVDNEENVKIYQQLKSTPNLTLPQEKDVHEFMNRLPVIQAHQHKQCQSMLITFLIYCNVRGIQLNTSLLNTIFTIASKFMCITHSHFFYKLSNPVFGDKFDSEAQAFWLFVSFLDLMRNIRFPLTKEDALFCPQETVIQYLEFQHQSLMKHCKIYDIAISNIIYDILISFYTNIVQSLPLYNIWSLIIRKMNTNKNVYLIVLIVLIEELGDKLLLCQNTEDFKNAISLQAQLMDILQLEASYSSCESTLNRVINSERSVYQSIEHSNIHEPLIQDN